MNRASVRESPDGSPNRRKLPIHTDGGDIRLPQKWRVRHRYRAQAGRDKSIRAEAFRDAAENESPYTASSVRPDHDEIN